MTSFAHDLRYAARTLLRTPGVTAVAMLTLALGTGAGTAIFSVLDAALLRPMPYRDSKDIVALWEQRPHDNQLRGAISAPDFVDWRRMAKSFSSMAQYDSEAMTISSGDESERVYGARVTPGFLEALGVDPLLGRAFLASEGQAGGERVAILTYGMWQRRMGGSPALGNSVEVDGEPYRVVGVLPRDFRFPFASECALLTPLHYSADQLQYRGIHPYGGLARLRPGVTLEQARAEMAIISRQLEQTYPESNTGHAASLVPLKDELAWRIKPALGMLSGAVFLLVLIACANVASLLLARGTARRSEMALRAALGASRWRLIRQSLAESALLAAGSAAAGMLLASWALEVLRSVFFRRMEFFSRAGLDTVGIDWRVLAFTIAAAVMCALICGVWPAATNAGVDLSEVRAAGRTTSGAARQRFHDVLVVIEVALSLVLLTGAGLLTKSFLSLLRVDPGFRAAHLMATNIDLPAARYRTTQDVTQFSDRLLREVRALPGVQSAALTDTLPLSGDDNRTGVIVEGREETAGDHFRLHPRMVSANYLDTMGVPLLAGRAFTRGDEQGKQLIAIVSEAAARRFWPNQSAVGRRFAFFSTESPWIEVVGVAGGVHNQAMDRDATEDVYILFRENPFHYSPTATSLVLRTSQEEAVMAPALRQVVGGLDRSLPLGAVHSMDYYLGTSVAPRRFNMVLVAIIASLALALAAAGLYGVLAYVVSRRNGEIGIRMALGAQRADVMRMVIGRGLRLACAGVAAGLLISLAAARVMSSLLFDTKSTDAGMLAAGPVVLLAVAALACYIPARRASRVDPMVALRME